MFMHIETPNYYCYFVNNLKYSVLKQGKIVKKKSESMQKSGEVGSFGALRWVDCDTETNKYFLIFS